MLQTNSHFSLLQSSYLFVEIARRVQEHSQTHPDAKIIRLGIGDVTEPLTPTILKAFKQAVEEMGKPSSFRGYGPEQGYDFLREAIATHDYQSRGCAISADDVFVSDGAKCDSGNFQEIFSTQSQVAVPDPVYPVYVDSNVMAGRARAFRNGRYEGLIYLEGKPDNGFVPLPENLDSRQPHSTPGLIYLCFPNNPTGATATREQLQAWVDWAIQAEAIILFDAAYEAFIQDETLPRSIYEIPGAQKCAVEFRSFSKTAGFTGTRCAFTVVPKNLKVGNVHLHALWTRRQSTKFNGVSYPVQRAAEAVYSAQGLTETRERINFYLQNAAIIRKAMESLGYKCWGGQNSPYIWIQTGRNKENRNEDSWQTFDRLLKAAHVVVTPGSGFGRMGEGFIRISAFNSRQNVEEAMERISRQLGRNAGA